MEAQAGMGLIKGHAYGILDVRKVSVPVAYLEWVGVCFKILAEQNCHQTKEEE